MIEKQAPQFFRAPGFLQMVGHVLEEIAIIGPTRPTTGTSLSVCLDQLPVQTGEVNMDRPNVIVLEVVQ